MQMLFHEALYFFRESLPRPLQTEGREKALRRKVQVDLFFPNRFGVSNHRKIGTGSLPRRRLYTPRVAKNSTIGNHERESEECYELCVPGNGMRRIPPRAVVRNESLRNSAKSNENCALKFQTVQYAMQGAK